MVSLPPSAPLGDLVEGLVDPATSARWGVYQGVHPGPAAEVGRWIEADVFHQAYGLDQGAIDAEFGPYDPRTVWSILVNHDRSEAVGAVRSVVGPVAEHKFVADLAEHWDLDWSAAAAAAGLDPDAEFVEACTYSVMPTWRTVDRGWPAKVLLAVQLHLMTESGAAASTQVINPRVLRMYRQWGVPFATVAPAVDIDGSPFVPAFVPTEPGHRWLRSTDTEFVRLVQERDETGRGGTRLEPIDLDGSAGLRLHRALCDAAVPEPGPAQA